MRAVVCFAFWKRFVLLSFSVCMFKTRVELFIIYPRLSLLLHRNWRPLDRVRFFYFLEIDVSVLE